VHEPQRPEASSAKRYVNFDIFTAQQCAYSSPMPPWVASVPRMTSLCSRRPLGRTSSASCYRHIVNQRSLNVGGRFPHLRVRSASTHVAPIAINLRPNIPPRNQELYNALSALSGVAETYVNISRLQLALSGLAAQDAVTRVAGMEDAIQLIMIRGLTRA
jgi:hypothetical protein